MKKNFYSIVFYCLSFSGIAHTATEHRINPIQELVNAWHTYRQSKESPKKTLHELVQVASSRELIHALAQQEYVDQINKLDGRGFAPLHHAAHNNKNIAIALLITANACVNITSKKNKWTPLHFAAHKGHLDAVTSLIEHNATVKILDNKEKSPLFLAENNKHIQVASALIRAGAHIKSKSNNPAPPEYCRDRRNRVQKTLDFVL